MLDGLTVAPIDYSKIKDEDLDISYTPIKYQITLTPNDTAKILKNEVVLDTNRVKQKLSFSLNYTGANQEYAK